MKLVLSYIGRFLFFLMGWKFIPLPPYFDKKHVIIGFPHTSNMDTVRAFTGFKIAKLKGHVIMKKELFFFPMSIFFKMIGGIPVDRSSKSGVVEQMALEFEKRESFYLSIVPEGTRKKTDSIRTGFWHIAKKADVSIILWYLDNETKTTRWLGEINPKEIDADISKIRSIYKEAGYNIP
ncbi:MAG: acyl-phosphate glycerol 3-phosphate acyltransferase [Desulfobacterales bacterium]|nr:acyl-phosphate glycerol 3-phosphate acyltransferase [Desulfobacterales bacterium]